MPIVRDDDEERLARVEQMIEDLRSAGDDAERANQLLLIELEKARLSLEGAQRSLRRARIESAGKRQRNGR